MVSCTMSPPERFSQTMSIPREIPSEYSSLKGIPLAAIYKRLLVLNYFSHNILSSWRLFSFHQTSKQEDIGTFYVNPLHDSISRLIISPTHVEGLMGSVLTRTMNSSSHGPSVTINRIEKE